MRPGALSVRRLPARQEAAALLTVRAAGQEQRAAIEFAQRPLSGVQTGNFHRLPFFAHMLPPELNAIN